MAGRKEGWRFGTVWTQKRNY